MKGNESGTDEKNGLLWIHSSCLFCILVSFHKLFFYKKGDHSVESFYELLTKPWSKKFFHPKIRDFQGQIKSRKKWNLVIELFFPDSMRLFLHSEGFIMKMWQYLVSLEKNQKWKNMCGHSRCTVPLACGTCELKKKLTNKSKSETTIQDALWSKATEPIDPYG